MLDRRRSLFVWRSSSRNVWQSRDSTGHLTVQVFATDIDKEAVERARQGLYRRNIVGDVSVERLQRYFSRKTMDIGCQKTIREMAVFAPQNCFMDPPFTKLDLL